MPDPYYPLERSLRRSNVIAGDGETVTWTSAFEIADIVDVDVWWRQAGETVYAYCEEATIEKTGPGFSTFTVTFETAPTYGTEFYFAGRRLHERSTAINKSTRLDLRALDYELTKLGIIQQETYRDLGQTVRAQSGVTPLVQVENPASGNLLAAGPLGTLIDAGINAAQVAATVLLAATLSVALAAVPLAGVKAYGAKGDGITDDTAAFDAMAAAEGGAVYLPPTVGGLYQYGAANLGAALGSKRLHGQARARTGANTRARYFSALTAAPTSYGNQANIDQAFNGDLSRVQFDIEHRVTGSTTLTQPTSAYVIKPETAAIYGQFYNSSGYNHQTAGNTGRTGTAFMYLKMVQAGQADMAGIFMEALVTSAKTGATHFLASPAAGLFGGQMTAAVAGCYLNPFEVNLQGNTFDCSGIGPVVNMSRGVPSSSLNTYWGGMRVQSKGAAAIDDAYYASGKMNAGLNVVLADFSLSPAPAAVLMKAGQRIYGNGVQLDTAGFAVPTFGTEYIGYETAEAGWQIVVAGGSVVIGNNLLKIGGSRVLSTRQSALPANASDLATAITLVNAIKTGLSATSGHGLFT